MPPAPTTNSFQKVFEDAEAEFAKITGRDHKGEGDLSLADVLDILDHRLEPRDPEEQKKKDRTKSVVKTVLQGLQVLNGVAAQALSSLMPQSNVCFNAVGWLLTLPQRIEELYDGIHELFEEIHSYLITAKILKRIDEHDGVVAQELIDSTANIMTCFVRIIAGCYDAWRPRHKFRGRCKLAFKAVFVDEGANVQANLDDFKRLLEKQQALTGFVTLEAVLKTNRDISNVKRITEAVNLAVLSTRDIVEETLTVVKNTDQNVDMLAREVADRRLREVTSKDKEEILKAMNLDEGDGRAACEEQERALKAVAKDVLPGSGQWLKDLLAYQEWRESSPVDHVLVLCGKSGSGKHYLAAQTTVELREQETNGAQSLVGYYHFTKSQFDTKDKDLGLESVARALKVMAWQIADRNLPYRRELLSSCKADPILFREKTPALERLWKALKFASSSNNSSNLFFLVFDGFHRLEYTTAQILSKIVKLDNSATLGAVDRLRFRVLLTSINEGSSNVEKLNLLQEQPQVVVDEHNRPDIVSFIKSQLEDSTEGHIFDSLTLLLEAGDDEDLSRGFYEEFPVAVGGVFENVTAKLKRVKRVIEDSADDAVAQIKEILAEQSDLDRVKVAESELARLNDSLNAKEIDQLNIALQWLVYGAPGCTINIFRALFSAMEIPWFSGLQTFADKVKDRNKFGSILSIHEEYDGLHVKLDDGVSKCLQRLNRDESQSLTERNLDQASVTLTITFNRASRENVKTFFSNFGERIASEPWVFPSLEPKRSTIGIHVDRNQSYSTIAEQCLAVLMDDPEDATYDMITYAISCLPSCLREYNTVSDLSVMRPVVFRNRKKILRGLVSILTNVHLTVEHWARAGFTADFCLLDSNDTVATFSSWLHHDATKQELKPRHRRRLEKLLADHPEEGEFWEPLTLEVARHWLLYENSVYPGPSSTETAFEWIARYLEMRAQLSPRFKAAEFPIAVRERRSEVSSHEIDSDAASDARLGSSAVDNTLQDSSSIWDGVSDTVRITRTADWIRRTLGIDRPTPRWYSRLADTYRVRGAFDECVMSLKEAIEQYPRDWYTHRKLVQVYQIYGELKNAMEHLEAAIDILQDGSSPGDLLSCQIHMANLQMNAGLTDRAISSLSAVLQLDKGNHALRTKWLKALQDDGRQDEVVTFLHNAQKNRSLEEDLDELSYMLYALATMSDQLTISTLLVTMKRCGESSLALESIAHVTNYIQAQQPEAEIALLFLAEFEAALISLSSPRDEKVQLQAFEKREAVIKLMIGTGDEGGWLWMRVNTYQALYCFQRFLTSGSPELIRQIESISKSLAGWDAIYANSYLARCRLHQGRKDEAKQCFASLMKDAFDILSNNNVEDDWFGYVKMALIFEKLDEDENCLTVLSLIRPPNSDLVKEKQPDDTRVEASDDGDDNNKAATEGSDALVRGRFYEVCSLDCGKEFRFGDPVLVCKICPYAFFCKECSDTLRRGLACHNWCHPDHVDSFLEIPEWPTGDWSPGKDKVRIGGWSRPDGEVVDIDHWLNGIRKEWGIEEVTRYDRNA